MKTERGGPATSIAPQFAGGEVWKLLIFHAMRRPP
jgi:hypothetical protein